MTEEIRRLKELLDSFLGEPKRELDDSLQLEYPCPRCIEKYGNSEIRKANLSVSLTKQRMNCWRCSSEGEDVHGSILKLIRMFGSEGIAMQYREIIKSIRESELYKLHYSDSDFNIDASTIEKDELKFPESFKFLKEGDKKAWGALKYLSQRGIGWDIINKHKIGYTTFEKENKKGSFRVVIPSYDKFGELNYWVGRDFLPDVKKRIKYDNPKVDKSELIFGEELLSWDADINIVEGPFDHIVVPNSVPLLGKALNQRFKLYWELVEKANANINIFLDGDAKSTMVEIYKLLNHGRLYDKIRYIPVNEDDDPSSIYQKWGRKGIMAHINNATKIDEVYLI